MIAAGGQSPAASKSPPPGNVLGVGVSGESVRYVARLCFGLMSDLLSCGVCLVICGLVR